MILARRISAKVLRWKDSRRDDLWQEKCCRASVQGTGLFPAYLLFLIQERDHLPHVIPLSRAQKAYRIAMNGAKLGDKRWRGFCQISQSRFVTQSAAVLRTCDGPFS